MTVFVDLGCGHKNICGGDLWGEKGFFQKFLIQWLNKIAHKEEEGAGGWLGNTKTTVRTQLWKSFQQTRLRFSGSRAEKHHNRRFLTRKLNAGVSPRVGITGDCSEKTEQSAEQILNSVSIRPLSGSPRHQTHFKDFPPDVKIENRNYNKNGDWWITDSVTPGLLAHAAYFKN